MTSSEQSCVRHKSLRTRQPPLYSVGLLVIRVHNLLMAYQSSSVIEPDKVLVNVPHDRVSEENDFLVLEKFPDIFFVEHKRSTGCHLSLSLQLST